jgi:prepilin-type N-terminal cleavage/methylation domain-containing protein
MKRLPFLPTRGNDRRGFTIVEMVTTLLVLGVLIAISIPNYTGYKLKAQFAALEEYIDIIMDGQELYFTEHGHYFPENGTLRIPSRTAWRSTELGITLPEDHPHRFMLYSMNREFRGRRYNYVYLVIYSDIDFNRNGHNDMFMVLTYFYNDRQVYNRRIIQYW